jgi:hypothetical protein
MRKLTPLNAVNVPKRLTTFSKVTEIMLPTVPETTRKSSFETKDSPFQKEALFVINLSTTSKSPGKVILGLASAFLTTRT